MAFLILGVAAILGLVNLVCWIIVLIKMFSSNVVTGIIGLICGLYALIWGWQNKSDGLEKVMPVWTLCIVGNIILQVVAAMLTPR